MGEFYLWLSIFLLKVISLKNKIIVMMGVCLAATGLNAQAADVRVKGTIAPASCSFTIVNSVFDYGMIRPSSLSATHYTKLDKKSTPFTVKCDAPTLVSIKTQDNRASSKVPGMMRSAFNQTYVDTFNYGLGTSSKGEKVGGYVMFMANTVADGKAVRVNGSNNNGVTWSVGDGALAQPPHLTSWASGTTTPIKLSVVSGNLQVQGVINKTSAFSVGEGINLDGHATLELRYL
jgi:type 1 fimbria pilin